MNQSPAQPDPLPTPAQLPEADIVIYDGKCVFCMGQVRNLLRLDGRGRLAFISLHDPVVGEQFPDLSHEQMMEQLYLIPVCNPRRRNERLGGAAAVRYLTYRLPKLWILFPLLHIPFSLPFWQWAYNQIAKRRYRIANANGHACDAEGTCKMHLRD